MTLVERFVRPYKHLSTLKNLKLSQVCVHHGAELAPETHGRVPVGSWAGAGRGQNGQFYLFLCRV